MARFVRLPLVVACGLSLAAVPGLRGEYHPPVVVPILFGTVPIVVESYPPEVPNQGRISHRDIVTAVDENSITVAVNPRREMAITTFPDRKARLTKIIIYRAEPARRFAAGKALAAPITPGGYDARYNYKLSHVLVGDYVEVVYVRVNGADIVEQISILRRPGGFVPPAPGEDTDDSWVKRTGRWHEKRNAIEVAFYATLPVLPSIIRQTTR